MCSAADGVNESEVQAVNLKVIPDHGGFRLSGSVHLKDGTVSPIGYEYENPQYAGAYLSDLTELPYTVRYWTGLTLSADIAAEFAEEEAEALPDLPVDTISQDTTRGELVSA